MVLRVATAAPCAKAMAAIWVSNSVTRRPVARLAEAIPANASAASLSDAALELLCEYCLYTEFQLA
jgi:hypothetical protein